MPSNSLLDLFEAVRRFLQEYQPGSTASDIDITLRGDARPLHLLIPSPSVNQATPVPSHRVAEDPGVLEDERASPRNPIQHRCIKDILATLREVGRPLTTNRLLEEMARRGHDWSERTVAQYLKVLMEDGTIENPPDAKPRGYRESE